MDTKEKNYWPLGILSILFIGLGLVVALVVVAIKYTPQSDNSYLHQHTYTDSHINGMLAAYNAFKQAYGLELVSGGQKLEPLFPFYLNQNTPLLWLSNRGNHLGLQVRYKDPKAPTLIFSVSVLRSKQKPLTLDNILCETQEKGSTCQLPPFNLPLKGRYQIMVKINFKGEELPLIQPAFVR
ncbi:hypothetical protein [Helicobacter ailurogastricus]|uniref:Uncharacterized protein n=1 Tax=Helicobacter ailurogastricus TaxID=1578720 RepID=A0A0K2XZZ3_9HELI|nr:hypothetical protein [Helicobacter ailurogastricus]CRF40676.1 hypothetical protein HAL011_04380 [Helicobacter ailurogastricus]CRF43069.1 hypothetical protein HAL013_12930 [Helicobacter ailurogastricus]CRF44298.1 hypothetical protein HAL09_08740 [Helicobacter ailurogastricus]CRF52233.1 hypothetical protein HAL07_03590 [Helicobacter ailurogastricus]BDQ29354.1 hypothetical protein ASB7_11910 [Helicobacter ailurogastricus]